MSMTGTPAPVRRRRRTRRGRVAVALVTCAVLVTGMVGGAVLAVGSARDQGYLGGPIVVPEEYRAVIREAAARCDAVPVEVLAAQIAAESGWDPEAVSPAGARGIAQFMPAVWKQYGIDANADGKASVWDPVDAIHAAAELNCVNRRLVREASGNRLRNTLAAYNAGFSTVLRYDGVPPYPETEEYVRRILANAESIVL
ncbi:MAG: lytic transglycosylase domain-containing protein [Actinomycetota bacterium]|nr:lytic transglycosylase domain-containing protein [Actinomycetota bacterium]